MLDKSEILTPHDRWQRLIEWLKTVVPDSIGQITPLAGDAGNRHYYRMVGDSQSYIVADDPSSAQWRQFICVGNALSAAAVRVPHIHAVNEEVGFLLLEDFGDTTFLSMLPDAADKLYEAAFQTLIRIQQATLTLPAYDETLLTNEMALFADWYCPHHLRKNLTTAEAAAVNTAANWLQKNMREQAQVLVHRDYHARNLMVLPAGALGVVDFQDAVIGAATYDIVSLLRDAYVEWTVEQQRIWLARYWQQARAAAMDLPDDMAQFWQDYNITGAQRGLKVLGIFARLAYRDGKRQFIADMPIAYRHLLAACQQLPPLHDLGDILAARPPHLDTE